MIGEDIIENNDDENIDDEEEKSEEYESTGDDDVVVEEKIEETANILQDVSKTFTLTNQHADVNGNQDEEADIEDDESDNEPAVEIGIEECEMLKDCLQRKLNLLISTQER